MGARVPTSAPTDCLCKLGRFYTRRLDHQALLTPAENTVMCGLGKELLLLGLKQVGLSLPPSSTWIYLDACGGQVHLNDYRRFKSMTLEAVVQWIKTQFPDIDHKSLPELHWAASPKREMTMLACQLIDNDRLIAYYQRLGFQKHGMYISLECNQTLCV